MSGIWVLAAAILAGMAQATQAVYNSAIARAVGGSLPAAFISMATAAVILLAIALVRQVAWPSVEKLSALFPYPLLAGGALGAVILMCVLFATPRLGAQAVVVLFILGQLVASAALDHFGALGLPVHPLSLPRALGIGIVLVGAVLVIES